MAQRTPGKTVMLSAGTYVIGDPCYSVPEDRWMEWLEASDYTTTDVLSGSLDGHMIVGIGTAYGDGAYEDQHGYVYGVDAGMIGAVPVEIAVVRYPDEVRTVHFGSPVICGSTPEGTIFIGHLRIPTGLDDDEDAAV